MAHIPRKTRKHSDTTHLHQVFSLFTARVEPCGPANRKKSEVLLEIIQFGEKEEVEKGKSDTTEPSEEETESKSVSTLWDIDFR